MNKRYKVTTLFKKSAFLEDKPSEIKVIYIYRYISLVLTSLYYLIGGPDSTILFKLGVIFSLYVSSRIMMYLYIKLYKKMMMMKILILMETLGIILLLYPTGGLDSPFIWYALNPVLVAANYLNTIFCWLTLTLYLVSAAAMSINYFNYYDQSIKELIKGNAHLVLVFVLITLAVQLLSSLSKKLRQQSYDLIIQKRELLKLNGELQKVNDRLEDSIDHIMNLYQMMETFTAHDNRTNLFEVFAGYTAKLTKTNLAFFCGLPYSKYRDIFTINNNDISKNEKKDIMKAIEKYGFAFKEATFPLELMISGNRYSLIIVKSSSASYGLIGIQLDENDFNEVSGFRLKQLNFLANLCTVILERMDLEEIEQQLMLVEEQNRIANEIHDNVSQRLFSITYAIHALNGKWQSISNDSLKTQLQYIRESANSAMQELRASIYRLSSKKKGEKSLQTNIRIYLESLANLNDVTADLVFEGEEVNISSTVKKAIFRIVREATGNSVRHGRCGHIEVGISIDKEILQLRISDNGRGFNLNRLSTAQSTGLGICNMKNLVGAFHGEFNIYTELGTGVIIDIIIPNNNLLIKKEGGIAI